jgi:class 3 adenylate cyclase/tetratricopeptide (TPR) repeat protein
MEDLDPEEARAIVDPALKLMIDAVHHYDGYIVQSTGDGIFALFGAPLAHEDHPQRALYAALRIQEELRRYSERLRMQDRQPLQARVGVNTGEVVVRSIQTEGRHAEYTPIGHSTGLASRMQALAPIGSIAATHHTEKLCEGYFAFKSLGPATIKGVKNPVNVFEVTGLGPLRTRLQVSAQRGLTKFVGRSGELEQMKRALELAKSGHGQIVAAIGEPGVGKSRLFFEFRAMVQTSCLLLEAYSVSHAKASAYLPVIDLLKSYFEIMREDDERKRREKVAGKIVMLDRALEDTLPYLFELLGIVEGDDPMAQLDPQLQRRRTLEAIKRIFARESLNQPLIVIFEDLHWIDNETQALLNMLVDSLATARILMLVNYRPEYQHQWGNKTYYSQLRLDPLGRETADEMLAALLEDGGELAPLKRLIIERTEGNPFFMEEMVQGLFEQGVLARNGAVRLAGQLDEIRVPPTVQAILASRIDRLAAPEKELLQTLAVLGRDFPARLIRHMTAKADDELERMLSALQLAEFIYEQPAVNDVEYKFKHALTQEVAYSSVLLERRRMLHERAGQATEELFGDRLEDHLTELAHHYERSGNVRKAVEYLGRAGGSAAQQVAHSESVGYLNRALELLKQLPDSVERSNQELNLQMALSGSLFVLNPAASDREPVLICAQELSEKLRDSKRLMESLLELGQLRFLRRDYDLARGLAHRVLEVAKREDAKATVAGAHFLVGITLYYLGKFEEARQDLERAVSLSSTESLRNFAQISYGQAAARVLMRTLLVLGYPAAALRMSKEFVDAMRRLSDPVSLCNGLLNDAALNCRLRDSRTALKQAEEALPIAKEHGLSYLETLGLFFRGWALADAGRAEEGIAEMSRAIPSFEGTAAISLNYAELAECLGNYARPEEGLIAVAKGLGESEQRVEKVSWAQLYRIKGELVLMRDATDEAEAERCFRTAVDIARGQSAKWWELRAATSLARLLKRQGKSEEARTMLAEIYNWFTEGFEFADLKDAKALLDDLSA